MTAHRPPPGRLHLPVPPSATPSATPSARPDGAGFAPVHRPPTPARPLPSAPQPGATPGPGAALIAFPFPSPARPRATPRPHATRCSLPPPAQSPRPPISRVAGRALSPTFQAPQTPPVTARGPLAGLALLRPRALLRSPYYRRLRPGRWSVNAPRRTPPASCLCLRPPCSACPWREGLRPPTPGAPSTPPGGDFGALSALADSVDHGTAARVASHHGTRRRDTAARGSKAASGRRMGAEAAAGPDLLAGGLTVLRLQSFGVDGKSVSQLINVS